MQAIVQINSSSFQVQAATGLGSSSIQKTASDLISKVGLVYRLFQVASYFLGAIRCATHVYSLYTAFQEEDLLPKLAATLDATVSVINIAARYFHHPVGLVLSSTHGILKELLNVGIHGSNLEIFQLLQSLTRLTSHVICLAVLIYGSAHITFAFSAIEMLIGLYHLKQDILDVHFLEMASQLILRAIDLASRAI